MAEQRRGRRLVIEGKVDDGIMKTNCGFLSAYKVCEFAEGAGRTRWCSFSIGHLDGHLLLSEDNHGNPYENERYVGVAHSAEEARRKLYAAAREGARKVLAERKRTRRDRPAMWDIPVINESDYGAKGEVSFDENERGKENER